MYDNSGILPELFWEYRKHRFSKWELSRSRQCGWSWLAAENSVKVSVCLEENMSEIASEFWLCCVGQCWAAVPKWELLSWKIDNQSQFIVQLLKGISKKFWNFTFIIIGRHTQWYSDIIPSSVLRLTPGGIQTAMWCLGLNRVDYIQGKHFNHELSLQSLKFKK